MSAPEFKSCLDCRSHLRIGKALHLCTLPAQCQPPLTQAEADALARGYEHIDAESAEYVGTGCDRMRAMGAACGPRAALWEAKA